MKGPEEKRVAKGRRCGSQRQIVEARPDRGASVPRLSKRVHLKPLKYQPRDPAAPPEGLHRASPLPSALSRMIPAQAPSISPSVGFAERGRSASRRQDGAGERRDSGRERGRKHANLLPVVAQADLAAGQLL